MNMIIITMTTMKPRTHLRIVEARLGSLEKGVLDLPPGVTQ